MKHLLIMLLMVISTTAFGQTDQTQDEKKDGELDPQFAAMSREAGFVCGEFLPSQIPGITELMALCGGHFGFKLSDALFFEPQILTGAGHAQRYILGSASLRGDFQVDDFILSANIGADIHYPTQPIFNSDGSVGEETDLYFGGHVGGSLWWTLSRYFAVRTDMTFFINPGTSFFIGMGLVLRFEPEANQGQGNQN